MARAKRARRYGPGESLPGKVPLPRAEDEGGTCGGRVGGWSGEMEGGGRVVGCWHDTARGGRSVGFSDGARNRPPRAELQDRTLPRVEPCDVAAPAAVVWCPPHFMRTAAQQHQKASHPTRTALKFLRAVSWRPRRAVAPPFAPPPCPPPRALTPRPPSRVADT